MILYIFIYKADTNTNFDRISIHCPVISMKYYEIYMYICIYQLMLYEYIYINQYRIILYEIK